MRAVMITVSQFAPGMQQAKRCSRASVRSCCMCACTATAGSPVAAAAALVARSVAHPPLEAPGPGAPLEDIAAIAAAVTAMLGAHRIIHLEAASPSHWAFEGRWAQQTSHNPG